MTHVIDFRRHLNAKSGSMDIASFEAMVNAAERRRALAAQDARRAADEAREQRAWRVAGWVLVAGWAVIAAVVAWRISMGAV